MSEAKENMHATQLGSPSRATHPNTKTPVTPFVQIKRAGLRDVLITGFSFGFFLFSLTPAVQNEAHLHFEACAV